MRTTGVGGTCLRVGLLAIWATVGLVQTCMSRRPQMLMLWCVLGGERPGGTQGYMLTHIMDVG